MKTLPRVPLIFFLTLGVLVLLRAFIVYPGLPERMATHFGADGHANGWMTKVKNLEFLCGLWLFVTLVVGGFATLIGRLPNRPINPPHKIDWSHPLPRHYH